MCIVPNEAKAFSRCAGLKSLSIQGSLRVLPKFAIINLKSSISPPFESGSRLSYIGSPVSDIVPVFLLQIDVPSCLPGTAVHCTADTGVFDFAIFLLEIFTVFAP
jgi:hypothetical protein